MKFEPGLNLIRQALEKPLPGTAAQHLMAPLSRKTTPELLAGASNYRTGCVLMLLFPDGNGLMKTVLIERPVSASVHSGQISFPGGRLEPGDTGTEAAALRETEEEIGVPSSEIKVIGGLSTLFIPASNFLVYPHIGFVESTPAFRPSPLEVTSVLQVAIADLLRMKADKGLFMTRYGNLTAPCFNVTGFKIWGATAMIISEFREMMKIRA